MKTTDTQSPEPSHDGSHHRFWGGEVRLNEDMSIDGPDGWARLERALAIGEYSGHENSARILAEEVRRLRARIAAIHWRVGRSAADRATLLAIKDECENAIPELQTTLSPNPAGGPRPPANP